MTNPMDMTGRTIMITGASSGIGRETCRLLSELGARVILVARNAARLQQTASSLGGTGHLVQPFDLGHVEDLGAWFDGIVKTTGPLDGLVHSAGIVFTQPIRSWDARQSEDLFRVNLFAAFALTKHFRMKAAHTPWAGIVLLSSSAGLRSHPGLSVYSASKAGLIGFTRSVALELIRDQVRVNCVAPAMVETEMVESARGTALTESQMATILSRHPMGFGKPRDVAHSIAFLLAPTGRWINGTTLVVDGGATA